MEGNLFEGTLNIFVPIFIITWLCKFFSKLMHINLFGKILNWDCLFDIYILIHLIQFNPIGILSNSKITLYRYYIYQQLFEKSIDTTNNSFFFVFSFIIFIIYYCIRILFRSLHFHYFPYLFSEFLWNHIYTLVWNFSTEFNFPTILR